MPKKLCHEIPKEQISFGVKLYQLSKHKFEVVYGLQIKSGLSYSEAASEYGAAIMHALACDGKLDNGN